MLIRNHCFTRNKVSRRYLFWCCNKKKPLGCKVRVTMPRPPTEGPVISRGNHNHNVVTERRKFCKLLSIEIVDDISYFMTARGTIQLMVNGFPFTKQNTRRHMIFWACCQAKPLKCSARITTYRGENQGKFTLRGEHNHEIIKERRKAGVRKKLLEERDRERAQQKIIRQSFIG